jgi:putative acetyltransferase
MPTHEGGRLQADAAGEIVRVERPADHGAIRRVHLAAFPTRVEADLVDALRAGPGWLPALSLVAVLDGVVVGHVVATRGWVDSGEHAAASASTTGRTHPRAGGSSGSPLPALGVGPLAVHPGWQRRGVGSALMNTLISTAETLGETLLALLGEPDYYRRFGFRPAAELGVLSPDPGWGQYFQARRLADEAPRGPFRYAEPFQRL